MKKYTFHEIENSHIELQLGYYIIWTSELIPDHGIKNVVEDSLLFGFNSVVVKYSTDTGIIGDYPDWIDDTDDRVLNIALLEVIPDLI